MFAGRRLALARADGIPSSHPWENLIATETPSRVGTIFRPILTKGVAHWARMLLLLAAGYYVGHLLSEGEWLTSLRYNIYARQLKLQHRGEMYPQRTALILLNDDDYWGPRFEARKPLKRDELAAILDRLNGAGANTVVLDVDLRSPQPKQPDFDFPAYRAEDAALIAAIDRMCKADRHVILASSIRGSADGEHYVEMPSVYTAARPGLPCLRAGYIQLPDDMRILPGVLKLEDGKDLDSLSLAAVRIADPVAYDEVTRDEDRGFRYTRYLTEADFAARNGRQFIWSAAQLRDGDLATLRSQLADRIVLIGGHWHQLADHTGPYGDTFESPGGRLPGVMLHANYIEAILDRSGTFIPVSDRTAEILEGLLVVVLGIIGVLDLHASWKWGAFFGGLLLSILFTYVLLQNLGLFLDFFIPLLMIVVHTLVEEILHMRHQLHHLRHAIHPHEEHPHHEEHPSTQA